MVWHIDTHEMNTDELMEILEVLEARGYKWRSGHKPTHVEGLGEWVFIDYAEGQGLMFCPWNVTQEDLGIEFRKAVGTEVKIEEVPYV